MTFLKPVALGLQRLFDRLDRWLVGIAGLLLLAMALLVNVEVFGRYLFGFSTLIADEYSGYFFTWMTLLCLLYALRHDRLLRVEFVIRSARSPIRDVLVMLTALVGIAVCLVLAESTWRLLSINWLFGSRSLQPSQTPLWIPQSVMPVSFLLLAVGYLERFLVSVLRLGGHLEQEDGTA